MPAAVPSATLAWAGASDPQSGIVSFDVGVRQVVTMGPAMTLPASWEPMGSAYVRSKELSAASIPLCGGLDVQFAVRGCNGVGLCNESAFSSGARRVEPPGGGSVYLHHSPHASPGRSCGRKTHRREMAGPSRGRSTFLAFCFGAVAEVQFRSTGGGGRPSHV